MDKEKFIDEKGVGLKTTIDIFDVDVTEDTVRTISVKVRVRSFVIVCLKGWQDEWSQVWI